MAKAQVKWLAEFLGMSPKKLTEVSSFDNRLKMQKTVFFLKYLKVNAFADYDFNLYLRGPYSPTLAKDYYDLNKIKPVKVELSSEARSSLKWFASRDEKWLEVASSIISVKERYPNIKEKDVHSVLKMSKPWVDEGLFSSVVSDLECKRLITL